MKIGILTFHRAHNYGAVLQVYALQKYLESRGFSAEIIDYCPGYIKKRNSILPNFPVSFRIKGIVSWALRFFCRCIAYAALKKRYDSFEEFARKNLVLSENAFYSAKDFRQKSDYDAVVFGSDQIWNPNLCEGGDDVFFGRFNFCPRKIGYAISAGSNVEDVFLCDGRKKDIGHFFRISCREKALSDAVKKHTGLLVDVVVDPTLIADKKILDSIADPSLADGKFVFVYELARCKEIKNIAVDISRKLGLKILWLRASYEIELPCGKLINVSPAQFLGLIKNAECVLTTSFHGVALSIAFRRNFYFLSQGLRNENRIYQLLSDVGLIDRFIRPNQYSGFSPVSWDAPFEERLNEKIGHSRAFLDDTLRSISDNSA